MHDSDMATNKDEADALAANDTKEAERMATFRAVLESQELLPQILAKLPRRVCKSGEGGHPSSLPSHCCLVCCAHVCRQFLESSDHVYRGLLLTSTPSDGHCLAHLSWRRQYHIRTSLPSSMSKFQSMGWFSRQYRFSADIRRGVRTDGMDGLPSPQLPFVCAAEVMVQQRSHRLPGRAPFVLWLQPLGELTMPIALTDQSVDEIGWKPAGDELLIELFVTHVPSGAVASLGRLPLPVNPIPGLGSEGEGGLCGMLFERQGERLPHPCAFTADPFPPQGWPRCEEECALRKVVPFSPRVPDEDFYDSDGYPDDRPDFSQTCEFTGSQLWSQPTFVMDQARDTESEGFYDQQPTEPVVYPTLYCCMDAALNKSSRCHLKGASLAFWWVDWPMPPRLELVRMQDFVSILRGAALQWG